MVKFLAFDLQAIEVASGICGVIDSAVEKDFFATAGASGDVFCWHAHLFSRLAPEVVSNGALVYLIGLIDCIQLAWEEFPADRL